MTPPDPLEPTLFPVIPDSRAEQDRPDTTPSYLASGRATERVGLWRCLRAAFRTAPWYPNVVAGIWIVVLRAISWRRSGVPNYMLHFAERPEWRGKSLPRQSPQAWPDPPSGWGSADPRAG
jgi:hypothetical protein